MMKRMLVRVAVVLVTTVLAGLVLGLMVAIGHTALQDHARSATVEAVVVDRNRCAYEYEFVVEGRKYEGDSKHLSSAGKTSVCNSRARTFVADLTTVLVHYDPANVASNNSPKHTALGFYIFLEALSAACLVPILLLGYYTLTN